MSKKHFESLTRLVRSLPIGDNARRLVAERLADWCAPQNPRFNRERFLDACVLREENA